MREEVIISEIYIRCMRWEKKLDEISGSKIRSDAIRIRIWDETEIRDETISI